MSRTLTEQSSMLPQVWVSQTIEHDTIPDFTQITGVTIAGEETLSISRLSPWSP